MCGHLQHGALQPLPALCLPLPPATPWLSDTQLQPLCSLSGHPQQHPKPSHRMQLRAAFQLGTLEPHSVLLAPYPASIIPIVTFPFWHAGPMPLQSTASPWQSPGGAWLSPHLLSLRTSLASVVTLTRAALSCTTQPRGGHIPAVSPFPPEPILHGQWGLATVQHSFVRCLCAAVLAAASRHNSLRAGKAFHPSTAVVGEPGHTPTSWSLGVGAQQAQPDPKLGCHGTTCLYDPSVARLLLSPQWLWSPTTGSIPFTLDIPRAAGQRGQLASHDFILMSFFDSFCHRDVALGSSRKEGAVSCPRWHRGTGGLLSVSLVKCSLEGWHGFFPPQTHWGRSAGGKG